MEVFVTAGNLDEGDLALAGKHCRESWLPAPPAETYKIRSNTIVEASHALPPPNSKLKRIITGKIKYAEPACEQRTLIGESASKVD